jgi:putative restriction endonuclease
MIDFSTLCVGNEYDRPSLAQIWGYESYTAISRGVITPKNTNIIVFFITKEKQESLTQYEDHIDGDMLFWEGESGHGNDERIISRKDIIHIFYRDRHHSNFIYKGRALLRNYKLFKNRPSKFIFDLIDMQKPYSEIVAEVKMDYGISATEREAIITSRLGQGIYRKKSIELWKTCSVTGFTKQEILIASHIKPWKLSTNVERINPYNSLLLVPHLDKLFDKGYVGFETSGKILLSEKIDIKDWERIGIHSDMSLRNVPDETKKFLDYHCEYIYDLVAS